MEFELLQQKLESMICHAGWHKTPLWPGEQFILSAGWRLEKEATYSTRLSRAGSGRGASELAQLGFYARDGGVVSSDIPRRLGLRRWLLPKPRPPNAPLYLPFASRGRYTAAVSILRFDNDSFNASNFQFSAKVGFLWSIPAVHLGQYLDGTDFIRSSHKRVRLCQIESLAWQRHAWT
jgi:hypothetical protein